MKVFISTTFQCGLCHDVLEVVSVDWETSKAVVRCPYDTSCPNYGKSARVNIEWFYAEDVDA